MDFEHRNEELDQINVYGLGMLVLLKLGQEQHVHCHTILIGGGSRGAPGAHVPPSPLPKPCLSDSIICITDFI